MHAQSEGRPIMFIAHSLGGIVVKEVSHQIKRLKDRF
jgi:predicted alpha/beta hydrolase family esterase